MTTSATPVAIPAPHVAIHAPLEEDWKDEYEEEEGEQ